jgi:hypothetical protein
MVLYLELSHWSAFLGIKIRYRTWALNLCNSRPLDSDRAGPQLVLNYREHRGKRITMRSND